jgi:pheromone shutdown protein TraB
VAEAGPATASPGLAGPAVPPGPAPPRSPGRLTLIGAGHVFAIRETLRDAVFALEPDIVFLELDRGRLNGLLAKARGEAVPQPTGYIHKRLASFQEEMAASYGAGVGLEMLGALEGAQRLGAKVALVDDAADALLKRAVAELTWRERLRAVGTAVGGFAKSVLPGRGDAKAEVDKELQRYQQDPDAVLGELKRTFPTLHRVLIAERDERMSTRIRAGLAGARHGVAVVGDGHVGGMLARLGDLHPTVFRLGDVRAGRLPRGPAPAPFATGTPETVGFSLVGTAPPPREPPQA